MLVVFVRDELAALAQIIDDHGVCIEDLHAGIRRALRGVVPGCIDGIERLESVRNAQLKVFGAVSGRRVHGAGAGVELDVIGNADQRVAIEKRMTHRGAIELFAYRRADELHGLAELLRDVFGERFCDQQQLAVCFVDAVRACGSSAIIKFAGSVHGVVVQMTTERFSLSLDFARDDKEGSPKRARMSAFCAGVAVKRT